jgi:hypothetical protein
LVDRPRVGNRGYATISEVENPVTSETDKAEWVCHCDAAKVFSGSRADGAEA